MQPFVRLRLNSMNFIHEYFYSQTIYCHVILFRVVHSFPRLRVKLHACFSSDVWVTLYTLLPDCHRQHNPIVIASKTRLSSLWEPDCQHHKTRLSSPTQPQCYQQYNPIGIAIRTRLSSPVQPDYYRYENRTVIAMQPDCHRQYNPIVIAMRTKLSSPAKPDCHRQLFVYHHHQYSARCTYSSLAASCAVGRHEWVFWPDLSFECCFFSQLTILVFMKRRPYLIWSAAAQCWQPLYPSHRVCINSGYDGCVFGFWYRRNTWA